MIEAYEIKKGQVTKYSTTEKKKIKHIHFYHVIYVVGFLSCVMITFLIFKLCIDEKKKLSDCIALGSIFATYGSDIISVFSMLVVIQYQFFYQQ